jgi:hypothetical protein
VYTVQYRNQYIIHILLKLNRIVSHEDIILEQHQLLINIPGSAVQRHQYQ